MNNSSLFSTEKLTLEFSNAEFVLKTQQQIAKDFGSCGVDFPNNFLVSNYTTNEILDEIQLALKKVHSIEELLYRIDVPEELFIHSHDFDTLSKIILQREAYKILLRKMF